MQTEKKCIIGQAGMEDQQQGQKTQWGSATANHHAKQIDNDKQHLFELNDDKILTSFQSAVTVWNA